MGEDSVQHFCQCHCGDMSGIVDTIDEAEGWYERHARKSTTGMHNPTYGTVGDGDGDST